MADPVSWLLIERGWSVLASDGSEIGHVDEVVGDSGEDIFDGLTITSGTFGRPRYVPSELVGEINEGRVHLQLPPDGVDRLEEYTEPPPSERIEPVTASRWQRFTDRLLGR